MQREIITFDISRVNEFKTRLFLWVSKYSPSVFFDSHSTKFNNSHNYNGYQCLAAAEKISELLPDQSENFNRLAAYHTKVKDWLFGFFTYELKNEIEVLSSQNHDKIEFPKIHFFQPEFIFVIKNNTIQIMFHPYHTSIDAVNKIFEEICATPLPEYLPEYFLNIQPRISQQEYYEAVANLKNHIKRGDIYEVNLCQEFYAQNAVIEPSKAFLKLQDVSPTPFSCWYKLDDKYLLCSSPERFLKKEGLNLISQPIKGTAPRGKNLEEDNLNKNKLHNDQKERSENIMIVDLVRNDLSRTAMKGSVRVKELCEIYSYPQVHQMISTIESEINPAHNWTELIKTTFPMGSMTGAPKIKAMEFIEKYENTKRGLYSGSVGYVKPNGDFDFNVVIRSILYNQSNKYISYQVGGAITWDSIPEKEYEECILKAKALQLVLNPSIINTR